MTAIKNISARLAGTATAVAGGVGILAVSAALAMPAASAATLTSTGTSTPSSTSAQPASIYMSYSFEVKAARTSGEKTLVCPAGYYIPGLEESNAQPNGDWFEPYINVSGKYITQAASPSDIGKDQTPTGHYAGVMVNLYNWSILSSHIGTVSFTCDLD